MTTRTKATKRATKPHGTKRTKMPAPAPMTEPAPALVDEAPAACELCGEPAGEGGALCPACAASRCARVPMLRATIDPVDVMVRECVRLLNDPTVTFDVQEEPAVQEQAPAQADTPVMTRGVGKSARTLVRWLRDQRRRGGILTEQQEADIYEMARAAWREAEQEMQA